MCGQCQWTSPTFRRMLARCALFVTDYSSASFDAAYLDRPMVYYQFDRERPWPDVHVGRKGYFDYERDGFGPVALTHEGPWRRSSPPSRPAPRPSPIYQERIDHTFVDRDGRACERVVAAIEELSRPYRAPQAPGPDAAG